MQNGATSSAIVLMAFCLYEALFPLFLILYMGWVFRDRGVGWLPFTCVFRAPRGSLLRACFQLPYVDFGQRDMRFRVRDVLAFIESRYRK